MEHIINVAFDAGCKKTHKDAINEAVNELKAGNDEQTTTPSSEVN